MNSPIHYIDTFHTLHFTYKTFLNINWKWLQNDWFGVKFLNEGQICIAPDYLLIEESVKPRLLQMMKDTLEEMNARVAFPYSRPRDWCGYLIRPIRMEFMEFQKNRLHIRVLYLLQNGLWEVERLQP